MTRRDGRAHGAREARGRCIRAARPSPDWQGAALLKMDRRRALLFGRPLPLREAVGDHAGRLHSGLAQLREACKLALHALAFLMHEAAEILDFGDGGEIGVDFFVFDFFGWHSVNRLSPFARVASGCPRTTK